MFIGAKKALLDRAFARFNTADMSNDLIVTNGNLTVRRSPVGVNSYRAIRGNKPAYSGDKKYYEAVVLSQAAAGVNPIGCANAAHAFNTYVGGGTQGFGWASDGNLFKNGGAPTLVETYAVGDILSFACDFANGKMWVRKNGGIWNNSAPDDPETNTGGYTTSATTFPFYPMCSLNRLNDSIEFNFGRSGYRYGVPVGFGNW